MSDLHTLLTGLALGASPRWHDGRLWLADWGAGEILAIGAASSSIPPSTSLRPSLTARHAGASSTDGGVTYFQFRIVKEQGKTAGAISAAVIFCIGRAPLYSQGGVSHAA